MRKLNGVLKDFSATPILREIILASKANEHLISRKNWYILSFFKKASDATRCYAKFGIILYNYAFSIRTFLWELESKQLGIYLLLPWIIQNHFMNNEYQMQYKSLICGISCPVDYWLTTKQKILQITIGFPNVFVLLLNLFQFALTFRSWIYLQNQSSWLCRSTEPKCFQFSVHLFINIADRNRHFELFLCSILFHKFMAT